MSTHIDTIKGIRESLITDDRIPTDIHLTRFYGGSENGRMLQITVSGSEGYIQLTKEEVFELADILKNSFNDDIYPSE